MSRTLKIILAVVGGIILTAIAAGAGFFIGVKRGDSRNANIQACIDRVIAQPANYNIFINTDSDRYPVETFGETLSTDLVNQWAKRETYKLTSARSDLKNEINLDLKRCQLE